MSCVPRHPRERLLVTAVLLAACTGAIGVRGGRPRDDGSAPAGAADDGDGGRIDDEAPGERPDDGADDPGAVADDPCADPFADPETILSLHLRTSRADWDAFGTDELADVCNDQYPERTVEFRCGDQEPWITIAARKKRGGDNAAKPSLKLDFNEVVQGQRWPAALGDLGFRKLTLNNGQNGMPDDRLVELIPEYLAWRLMGEVVPAASRVAHARLYVELTDDGAVEYRGLYVLIEDLDRTALRRRSGGDATGRLWKKTRTGGDTGDCLGEWVFDDGQNEATDRFDAWMAADPYGTYEGGWSGEARAAFNLDDVLRIEAFREILLEPTDFLFDHMNNHYFFDPAGGGVRTYLPWDLDWMFRGYPPWSNYSPELALSWDCTELGDRTRCHPEIRPLYLATMCELMDTTLAPDRLVAEYQAVDARIHDIVGEEVDVAWGGVDPRDSVTAGEESYGRMLDRMPTLLPDRVAFLRAAIEAEGVSCP